ncbi:hypothetical protein [Sabulicella glaciei]|uniref:hypothetical protein n=1 Tax=Sabulicella glaciei TaxID=2984948 RepID=UPI00265B3496|nr:hypothetical protein [Roseococcus sp. MDT2-1-1]
MAKAPALHPRLPDLYHQRVASLREAMAREGGVEVCEALWALVERVEVHRDHIELQGTLSAKLGMGLRNAESPSADSDGLSLFTGSVKVDAGTRKHLDLLLVA